MPTLDGVAGRDRRPRRSGGSSPRTITCSAARRRGCGSTMCCRDAVRHRRAADGRDRRRALRPHRRLPRRATSSGRARCSSASTSRSIATTEGALDDLRWHRMIRDSGWKGRVVTAYRPDAVVDPDFEGFADNLDRLGEITGCDTGTWAGLSRRAPQAPRLLQGVRRDLVRPRPSDRRHRQPLRRGGGGAVRPRARGKADDERERSCSARRC